MKTLTTTATLLVLALLFVTPIHAGSATATMTVSTQVIARAIVAIEGVSVVNVTADDLERGYVDLHSITVRVKTNSRNGYLLQVNNVNEAFSRVELSGATMAMNVASESWIERPYVAGGDVMPVSARLHLAPGAVAGSYALPVAFSASPL